MNNLLTIPTDTAYCSCRGSDVQLRMEATIELGLWDWELALEKSPDWFKGAA